MRAFANWDLVVDSIQERRVEDAMIFKRNKRIKALEEYFGLGYVPDGNYPEYLLQDDGTLHKIEERLKALEKIKSPKKEG